MTIRTATLEDLPEILKLYEHAREFMAQTGNPTQWGDGYPKEELLREDIELQRLYVSEYDGKIENSFVYYIGRDQAYLVIEGKPWLNDDPYGVVHRIASWGNVKGSGSACLQWAFEQCGNLRIDTHHDNSVMQHVLTKNGFERCGVITVEDGTLRVGFHKIK